ncbi:hypothetical protein NXS98_10115 [Fontisphaera persica]|uniref:hypothetical protein n=1 Tax=Fontisphaera persica TaxID=2974023 RepID=UPI0024BF7898|nr:hypothetical protein [Fontisphaera persica]WCJ58080.1 hypothetical protein NXS98_10115 [Fontisphaera persica]
MESIHNQSEFDYHIDDRDWSAVQLLVSELQEELAERRSHLLYRLAAWSFALKVFKRIEGERIVDRQPSERDINYHRAMLGFLKGCGELLLHQFRMHQEIDPKVIGFGFDNLAATVESLRISERMWYGDMTKARREEILADVFGPESAA